LKNYTAFIEMRLNEAICMTTAALTFEENLTI